MDRKLNDLPESTNKFWDGEVELREMGKKKSHTHFFEQVASREIKCKCGFGLFIGVGDKVVKGKLTHFGEEIVFD